MPESDAKVKSIIDMALSALPVEMGCDDCHEFLAQYAEYYLAGRAMPAALTPVREHLERCRCCMEELNFLLEAMKATQIE